MINIVFETLSYFLRTYFHQDWMSDYSSFHEAIDDFVEHESEAKVAALHKDLIELLSEDDISESLVYDYGGNYSPKVDGLSIRDWLQEICKKTG
jgi:vacuolar-type H+-ATPase catalytic subunit A/Vma1